MKITAPLIWNVPTAKTHLLCASAGAFSFVGGASDLDAAGRIRNPGDLDKQIEGAMANVAEALSARRQLRRRASSFAGEQGAVDYLLGFVPTRLRARRRIWLSAIMKWRDAHSSAAARE